MRKHLRNLEQILKDFGMHFSDSKRKGNAKFAIRLNVRFVLASLCIYKADPLLVHSIASCFRSHAERLIRSTQDAKILTFITQTRQTLTTTLTQDLLTIYKAQQLNHYSTALTMTIIEK